MVNRYTIHRIIVILICVLASMPISVFLHESIHWMISKASPGDEPEYMCFDTNPITSIAADDGLDTRFGRAVAFVKINVNMSDEKYLDNFEKRIVPEEITLYAITFVIAFIFSFAFLNEVYHEW